MIESSNEAKDITSCVIYSIESACLSGRLFLPLSFFIVASPDVRELMERADFFIEQKNSHAASVELCKIAALAQKDFLHSYEQFK